MRCTWNDQRRIDQCRKEATMEAHHFSDFGWRAMCSEHAVRFPDYRDVDPERPQERLV